jgi:competence protein ComEC
VTNEAARLEHPLHFAGAPQEARGVRIDGALWLSLCALAGALTVENRLATTLTALAAFLFGWGLCSRRAWLAGTVLFALAGVRAEAELNKYEAAWQGTWKTLGAPKRCAVQGEVTRSPQWRGDALSFSARLSHAECDDGATLPAGTLARLYGGPKHLARGDRFEAVAQLGMVRLFKNIDLPDPRLLAARQSSVVSGSLLSLDSVQRSSTWLAHVDTFRAHVRSRIEATFSPPAVGMAKALVLGENDLSEEEDVAFRESGLSHLLAVSGTHLVFAVVSLVSGLTALLVRIPPLAERFHVARLSSAIGVGLALVYADFAGGSGSAWRAAWMLAAAFLMRAVDRKPNVARAIAVSIAVGVGFDALAVFDVSFMLSLAATTGLLTLGRRFAHFAERFHAKPARKLAEGIIATLSSVIPCSALLAALSPFVSLPGIVLNVLAAPFGEVVALPLCLSHTLLAPFPVLERGTAVVASGALLIVKQAAFLSTEIVGKVPLLGVPLVMPTAGHFAVLVLSVFAVVRLKHLGPRLLLAVTGSAVVALMVVELQARSAGAPTGELRVSILDVEQGDSALIDFPDGRVMLIDGGGFVGSPVDPGERVLLPMLRARRRTSLDVVVLSHPHPDHFGGLGAVAEKIPIGEFWDTGQGRSEGAGPIYAQLLRSLSQKGVPVRGPAELCGTRNFGGAELDIVGPCPAVIPNRNANDNSWVFRVRYGERAILFTGDAEQEQEHELLERSSELLRADLLKAGHHGSRTSTSPEFLAAVQPSVATLSCGVRNRYGHPHQVTLDTLSQHAVRALRLDVTGGVEWTTDGASVQLLTFDGQSFRSGRHPAK